MQMPEKVRKIQRKKRGKLKPFGGVSFHCVLHCGRAFELWYGGALLETHSPQTSGGLVLYMSKPGAKKKWGNSYRSVFLRFEPNTVNYSKPDCYQ